MFGLVGVSLVGSGRMLRDALPSFVSELEQSSCDGGGLGPRWLLLSVLWWLYEELDCTIRSN